MPFPTLPLIGEHLKDQEYIQEHHDQEGELNHGHVKGIKEVHEVQREECVQEQVTTQLV